MHFDIFGLKVPVKKVKDLVSSAQAVGVYNYKEKTILVDSSLKGRELQETYLHEMFHSVVARLGMHNANLSSDLEEIIVENFAQAILDNYKIIKK